MSSQPQLRFVQQDWQGLRTMATTTIPTEWMFSSPQPLVLPSSVVLAASATTSTRALHPSVPAASHMKRISR